MLATKNVCGLRNYGECTTEVVEIRCLFIYINPQAPLSPINWSALYRRSRLTSHELNTPQWGVFIGAGQPLQLGQVNLVWVRPVHINQYWGLVNDGSPLKRRCYSDEFFVTDCIRSRHFDNFRCRQWRKFFLAIWKGHLGWEHPIYAPQQSRQRRGSLITTCRI